MSHSKRAGHDHPGQGSTEKVLAGPVARLPRRSVAVTVIVTSPPTVKVPISARQRPPELVIVRRPDPLGPDQLTLTERRPLSSLAATSTGTSQDGAAPTEGRPTIGGRSVRADTFTTDAPPAHAIATDVEASPCARAERRTPRVIEADAPGARLPDPGPADSHRAFEEIV